MSHMQIPDIRLCKLTSRADRHIV